VLAVVGIVDEVDGDGSRPVRVENRHGEPCEQKVGNDLKPLTVGVWSHLKTVSSHGVPSVSLQVSQIEFWLVQARMTTSQMSPGSGAPLDTRQREWRNDLFRYVFDIRRRKVLVWIRYGEHIQIQTLSCGYAFTRYQGLSDRVESRLRLLFVDLQQYYVDLNSGFRTDLIISVGDPQSRRRGCHLRRLSPSKSPSVSTSIRSRIVGVTSKRFDPSTSRSASVEYKASSRTYASRCGDPR